METQRVFFKDNQVRKTLHNNEWWFAIIDVVEMLTDSENPQQCWDELKIKLYQEGCVGLSENIERLKISSANRNFSIADCINTETLLRIIQSISSSKAEIFKSWLARVAYETVQELENPEMAVNRTRTLYKAKGYSDNWIDKRLLSIIVREKLTDEWTNRDVNPGREQNELAEEISKAAFGVTPDQHKNIKGLKSQNLRDHMNDIELIFSMLGEAATTEITRADDAKGFHEGKHSARKGGDVAGKARKDLERKTRKRVVSHENYLTTPESIKRIEKKSRRVKLWAITR